MRERGGGRSKAQDKQMMPNKFAHHPLTGAQPFPEQRWVPPTQLPMAHMSRIFCGMEYGVEYPCGKLRPAVLATLPPCACADWHRAWEAENSLSLCKPCLTDVLVVAINVIFVLNLKPWHCGSY